MPNKKIIITKKLNDEIKGLCEEDSDILLVSLCTSDGFSIKSFASKSLNAEADKLAAETMDLHALEDVVCLNIIHFYWQ